MTDEFEQAQLEPIDPGELDDTGSGRHRQGEANVLALSYEFRGPLPPPEILAQYDIVVPGTARQIVEAFTSETAHRRRREIEDDKRANRGQWMGFAVAVVFLAAAVLMVLLGYPIPGTIIGGIDIIGLVTVFVVGRSTPRD